ncbi:enoyl-ACP reductase FabI [Leifsonia sp. NPDC102414]|uniref:enoyl-ACP reductase FabI n=1 Tax=Leifsonia sp. NPDC102414 TaxID=3364124 RepID=UPI0038193917
MNDLLAGKTVLVAGLYSQSSIAFEVARIAQEQGAAVILSSFGRRMKVAAAIAKRLPKTAPVVEFDATEEQDVGALSDRIREYADSLDGIAHCISSSYPEVMGDRFLDASWDEVAHSFQVSAYSYKSLVSASLGLLNPGASVVGCTVDSESAWRIYGWAGVAKGAYASINQYLALHLGPHGIRTNLVAAGPVDTTTMRSIEGIEDIDSLWEQRAPLAWDRSTAVPTAKAVTALLSDWFPMTTGEVLHVDGGFHAVAY